MAGAVSAISKLEKSFPAIDAGFTSILLDRAEKNGFTNKRLMDAVNHTIDTCKYPKPSIADIIGFNNGIRLHSYDEMVKYVTENNLTTNYFKSIVIQDRRVWIKRGDYELNKTYFDSL